MMSPNLLRLVAKVSSFSNLVRFGKLAVVNIWLFLKAYQRLDMLDLSKSQLLAFGFPYMFPFKHQIVNILPLF